jgi:threonine dehydratase
MGQRRRDIWAGVPQCNIFWTLWIILGKICRRCATVCRKDKVINQLTVTHEGVLAAGERIAGLVERTPLIASEIRGVKVWLKCECLQTGGSFKLRGATNRLLQLTPEEREKGVVAFSSGNHARGVAIAAKRLGIRAVIVMPADAPQVKVEGTRNEGAEIVLYDRRTESREAIARRLAEESGATVVPSFDDPAIVAGQGTAGLEIFEQTPTPPRRIVIPCGGGGLASGIALACPDAEIIVVEPEGWDDMGHSLELGEIVPVEPDAPPTLCDALLTPRVSPITFGILQQRGVKAVAISDAEVEDAIRFAWKEHGLVVEPGGAAALAALLVGKNVPAEGTVVVLSGGNIDPALHARIVLRDGTSTSLSASSA